MSTYTKPYLPIIEQADLLEKRGLVISDRKIATHYLSKIGYYRLSGYLYSFRKITLDNNGLQQVQDEFKDDVRFEDIIQLYAFDKQLRLILLDAIEHIEIALRVDVALNLGIYDSKAHLNTKYYHEYFSIAKHSGQSSGFELWQNKFNKSFMESREDFVVHFKQKYPKCQLPIWMAVELWDFGTLSMFINNLKDKYKAPIADQYGLKTYKLLGSWLHTINIVRNICAHHGRLWNRVLAAKPQYPKSTEATLLSPMVVNQVPANRIFAAVCIIQYLMRYISPNNNWCDKIKAHMSSFPYSLHVNHKMMGVVDQWDQWSLWNITNKDLPSNFPKKK